MARTRPVMSRWVLATACGFLLGYLTARATLNFGLSALTPFGALPRWGLTGLATGALQTWLAGDLLPARGAWLAASIGGFLLAGLPGAIPSADPNSYILTWAVGGALVGTIQWLALRRVPHRARFWPMATLVGFALGGLIYGRGAELIPESMDRHLASVILWTAAGIAVGLTTGAAMQRASRI